MTFNSYQEIAHDFAFYEGDFYPVFGICGEAGEIAEKVKKLIRDKGATDLKGLSIEDKKSICKEIGDCLWYLQELAGKLNTDFESIAQMNLAKLAGRSARGKLGGSGDER